MKTKLLIVMAVATLVMGCNREEKNLFDKSASERAVNFINNANDVLVNNTNGWNMIYFANPESTVAEQIHVTFMVNGQVKASIARSAKKMVTDSVSVWDIKNDICPLLSFDTYNSILHTWADPQEDGLGYEGDYEFLIMEATPNIVRLKGKKYGAYCVLYPVSADYDPCANYKACDEEKTLILGNKNLLTFTVGNTQYLLHDTGKNLFQITPLNQAPEDDAPVTPYCILADGIQLMRTLEGEENTNRRFVLGEDNLLHGAPGAATIGTGNAYNYFGTYMQFSHYGWSLDMNKVIPAGLADVIAQLNKELQTMSGTKTAKILRFHLTYNEDEILGQKIITYLLEFKFTEKTREEGDFFYKFDVAITDNAITLQYKEPYIRPGEESKYEVIAKGAPSLVVLLNKLSGTYEFRPEEAINPTLGSVLVNKENNDIQINLTGTQK